MKEKYVVIVREIILIVAFCVSAALSVRLLVDTFANGNLFSVGGIIYSILSITLQFLQLYSIMLSKTEFKKVEKGSNIKGIGYLFLYLGFTFISLVASFSFIAASIENTSAIASASNQTFENYDLRIELIDQQIESYSNLFNDKIQDATELDEMYVTAGAMIVEENIAPISEDINKLFIQRESIISERNEKSTLSIVSGDTFSIMAERLSFKGEDAGENFKYLFMAFLAIMIEIGIAVTSQPVETPVKVKEDKSKVFKYITSLLGSGSLKLNSDKKVSEETGLTINECKRYKEMLQTTKYKGMPLITTARGGSRANFRKEVMMRIVNTKLNIN